MVQGPDSNSSRTAAVGLEHELVGLPVAITPTATAPLVVPLLPEVVGVALRCSLRGGWDPPIRCAPRSGLLSGLLEPVPVSLELAIGSQIRHKIASLTQRHPRGLRFPAVQAPLTAIFAMVVAVL